MNKHIYIFLCLSIACAQIRSPTGGERDEESPLIEEMIPNNGSVNFKGKSILITFDEYVKLNNIREQLLISPPLSKQPEVSIKGKSVIVKWDEELKENSTYTFSFGEGIVDNNESNKLDSNKVVFSTGPKLDSLSLSGTVVDAYTREALSCAVLLHRANVDSAITNELPYYYGLSKKDGSFRFDNLKEGNYQLFALKDQDKNYKWTENELMAFYSDTISLGYQDSTLYELNVFRKKPDELSIKRYEASNIGKVEIVLNMEVDELSFEAIQFTYDKVFVDRIKPDSLVYWFDGIVPQENCALKILRANEILDTISVYAFESDKKREYPELGLNVNGVLKQNPKQKLQLFSNTPIKELDEEKIILKMDSTVAKADLSLKEFNLIEFANNWSNFRYGQLTMLPGAITDIFGQSNDSIDATNKGTWRIGLWCI